MSWTDERVALLTKLWADGLSASQIAGELGGVTRNAVIGKVHRLGLSGRAKSPSSSNRAKRTPRASGYTRAKPSAKSGGNGAGKSTAVATQRVDPVPDLIAPEPKKLDLIALGENTCKWPIGDPATDDFYFCGHKTKDDTPYCEYHAQLAFQPQAERRREKRAMAKSA